MIRCKSPRYFSVKPGSNEGLSIIADDRRTQMLMSSSVQGRLSHWSALPPFGDGAWITAHFATIRHRKGARRSVVEDLALHFGLYHGWLVVEGSHAKRDRSVDRAPATSGP